MARQLFRPTEIPAAIAAVTLTLLLTTSSSHGADFEKINQSITAQEELVSALVTQEDAFSHSLIEPLVQLAKLQSSANRFSDAQQTIAKALRTARIAHGLYDATQLPLLQIDIDTTIALSDWNSVRGKLDHYTWLLTDHIEQPLSQLVDSLLWLVSAHEKGVFSATEDDRIWHITRANMLSQALVKITQPEPLQDSLPHVQFLYSLSKIYYLEARAILAGGTTSYRLREAHAVIANVESRSNSQRRLYKSGLNTLTKIRAIMADSDKFNAEAIGLMNLRVADWQTIFGKADDITAVYGTVVADLEKAGVSETLIAELLQQPTPLPRANLNLSVAEEIYDITSSALVADENSTLRLNIFEATSDIPGIFLDDEPDTLTKQRHGDWGTVVAELTLDPNYEVAVKNSGFRTKSNVTPKQVKLLDTYQLEQKTLKSVQSRMTTLSFRPAFIDGAPVSLTFVVDYQFRDAAWDDQTPLLSMR